MRQKYDFYATPLKTIENLFNYIDLNNYGNNILEPSAGNGNFIKIIKSIYPNKNINAIEIRQSELENLQLLCSDIIIHDFLSYEDNKKYDIIIGNPPFNKALEFIEKSLSLLSEQGVLIFLLRTAFLESKQRYEFWQKNPITDLYVLSKRPSFIGNGTDSASYAWFIWDKNKSNQTIKIIPF